MIKPIHHCTECDKDVFLGRLPSGRMFELVYCPILMLAGKQEADLVIPIDHPYHSERFLAVHECWALRNRDPRAWFLEN